MTPRLVVAVGLLALVAFASTVRLDRDQAVSSGELALVALVVAAGAALALGSGVVAVGAGYAAFAGNRRRVNIVVGLVLTALLGLLIAIVLMSSDGPGPGRAPLGTSPGQPSGRPPPVPRDFRGDGDNVVTLTQAFGLGALLALVIAGATILYLARRRSTAVSVDNDAKDVVAAAIDESLDDLRSERDVRRAIIACYARMERALERAGSARRPAEAPFEYLVRVLERITANDRAARVLTELFERAKFSLEPMGEPEKQQAIRALELLRAEVSSPL